MAARAFRLEVCVGQLQLADLLQVELVLRLGQVAYYSLHSLLLLRLQLVGVDARLELPQLGAQLCDLLLLPRDRVHQVALPALQRLEVVELHDRHLAHLQVPLLRNHLLKPFYALLLLFYGLLQLLVGDLILHPVYKLEVQLSLLFYLLIPFALSSSKGLFASRTSPRSASSPSLSVHLSLADHYPSSLLKSVGIFGTWSPSFCTKNFSFLFSICMQLNFCMSRFLFI